MKRVCNDQCLATTANASLATSGWRSSGWRQAVVNANLATFSPPQATPQQFSHRALIPLQPHQIWRIDRGYARTK